MTRTTLRTALAAAPAERPFLVLAEFLPEGGQNPANIARFLADHAANADALPAGFSLVGVMLPQSPNGVPALGPAEVFAALDRDGKWPGLDVIPHVTAKDHNRDGIRSGLIGLRTLGIETLLALTGDKPAAGTGVFDVDSTGLIEIVRELDLDAYQRAKPGHLDRVKPFFVLAAVSPFKYTEGSARQQYLKMAKKIRSGADVLITQMGWDSRKSEEIFRVLRDERIDVPVFGNVYLLSTTTPAPRLMAEGKLPGCVVILWRNRASPDRIAWAFLLAVPPVSILCYLPFYIQLKTHTGAIALVRTPSDPLEFLWVNGIFIAIFFALLVPEIRKKPWLLLACLPFALAGYVAAAIAVIPLVYFIAKSDRDLPDVVAAFGLAILVACELIYMKDNMGETFFRMNTVFKCYLPAWLMLGTAAFVMAGQWFTTSIRIPPVPGWLSSVLTVVVVTILFILPFAVIAPVSNAPGTLDGLAFLDTQHPSDAGAITYLRSLDGSEILVEAEKGDYSYYSRVSSFTGIPAIVGQPFHEFMWRGDDDGWYADRPADIRAIYEQPEKTIPLMKKYNATLLYVGDSERERYKVTLPAAGLEKIYSSRGTDIYRLSG